MDELVMEENEEVINNERPIIILTDIDIKNGASIPTNSFVEVQWHDATDTCDVDTFIMDPSDMLCVARTYGKFIKEDEKGIMMVISEFLTAQSSDHVMCIPKGWIDYVKIIGGQD